MIADVFLSYRDRVNAIKSSHEVPYSVNRFVYIWRGYYEWKSFQIKYERPRNNPRSFLCSLCFLVDAFYADADQNHDRQQVGDGDDNAHAHDGGGDFLLPFGSCFNLYYKTIAIISLLGVGGMLIY